MPTGILNLSNRLKLCLSKVGFSSMGNDKVVRPQVQGGADQKDLEQLAPLLAEIIPRFLVQPAYGRYFQFWEDCGFHLTPNNYYSPIPDTRTFTDDLWQRESEMVGVDFNVATQLDFINDIFPTYGDEYNLFSSKPTACEYEFYYDNDQFSGTDALVLYCMIRYFKPKLILEVGSGFSTLVSARAALRNGNTRLVAIEPYPSEILHKGFPGLTGLIAKPVQEVGVVPFLELDAGDILFIDTSHVSRFGGEVNFLYLEVLPRLRPGVIVHIHDVFLPREYPREWLVGSRHFWNEQYLVHAFLAFNREFEVLFSIAYMDLKYPEAMREAFPKAPFWGGASLWLRRKS